MGIDDCFLLGYIAKTHGTKGEVVAVLDTDKPQQYKKLESVFVEINKQLVPFFIKNLHVRQTEAVILFDDVDTLSEAEKLEGKKLYVSLTMLPPLPGKEFYLHEIKGYQVIDKKLGTLGIIEEVLHMPQQTILQMRFKDKEVLFPHNKQTFTDIDKAKKLFYVALPEGLLDIYL